MTDFVIIPAYNEEKYIKEVIRNTKKYAKNIIVVDDGSNDDTSAIAEEENVIVLRHNVNLGKGAALKTGCDYALKSEAENIIVIDADGQHNPEKIDTFRKEISGNDIVFGYRELSRSMPFVLRFGNLVINKITSLLYGMKLKDTQCGYRAFTAEAYKKIRWQSSDYSMESEMIANAGKHHLKYREVPIKTIYGDKYKGTTVIDGIKIVLKMFTWRLFK